MLIYLLPVLPRLGSLNFKTTAVVFENSLSFEKEGEALGGLRELGEVLRLSEAFLGGKSEKLICFKIIMARHIALSMWYRIARLPCQRQFLRSGEA